MREAFAKLLTFFQQKYWHVWAINVWNFNETLTNDVVSFEQPGPDVLKQIIILRSIDSVFVVVDVLTYHSQTFKKTTAQ